MNVHSPLKAAQTKQDHKVVDCDIHPTLPSPRVLDKYLPERWRDYYQQFGLFLREPFLGSSPYPKATPNLARLDSWPPNGGPPGSDLDFMRRQHLDPNDVEFGILQLLSPNAQDHRNVEFGKVLSEAVNEWQVAEWTSLEPRLKASIMIPCEDPLAAAATIRKRARQKDFAQILMTSRTRELMGQRKYWPIFEAAASENIPLGIHVGGVSGQPITPGGWQSFYFEDHYNHSIGMQALLASFVFEGVFETFPDLKVISIEAGFGWVPSFKWRIDHHWERMRSEVPHLTMPPSKYIERNVWFTTQPVEEPEKREYMLDLLNWVGIDRLLISTDYPHWDFDDPRFAFKAILNDEQKRKVYYENAYHVFGLKP